MPRKREVYNFSKEIIRKRSVEIGGKCEHCGLQTKLFGHHLLPFFLAKKNPVLTPHVLTCMENLLLLCKNCHQEADEDQRTWTYHDIGMIAWALFNIDPKSVADAQNYRKRKQNIRKRRARKRKQKGRVGKKDRS